jgi:hypothetical protein
MFIEFTKKDGKSMFIEMSAISTIQEVDDGAAEIHFQNRDIPPVELSMTYQQVRQRLLPPMPPMQAGQNKIVVPRIVP